MNQNTPADLYFAFGGLVFFGILLLLSLLIKIAGGRFFSFPFSFFLS